MPLLTEVLHRFEPVLLLFEATDVDGVALRILELVIFGSRHTAMRVVYDVHPTSDIAGLQGSHEPRLSHSLVP